MGDEIKENLVFLVANLTNLAQILLHLIQDDIISEYEEEEIKTEKTHLEKNRKLFLLLQRKNWDVHKRSFLEILRKTNNEHCANKIEGIQRQSEDSFREESSQNISGNENTKSENEKDSAIDMTVENFERNSSQDMPTIQLNHFEKFEVVNSGAFGLVMKVRHKETKTPFAIKITHHNYYRDVESLRQSSHTNIVNFINSWSELSNDDTIDLHEKFQDYNQMFCIQMELCNGRDLNSWILRPPPQKLEWDAKRICFQISVGVESLHSKNIIHRDLKPSNILLLNRYSKGQEDLIVKIGDLGLSRATYQETKRSKRSLMTNCGIDFYMSPEQERKTETYDTKADIFAMGIIFYELLNSTFEKTELSESIRRAYLPRVFIDKFAKEAEVIRKMLVMDPSNRPKAKEVADILKNSWNIAPSLPLTSEQI